MTFLRFLRAGFHTVLLFALPWAVGALVGMVFDVGEVTETGDDFARLFGYITVPLIGLQLVAVFVKVGREKRALRTAGIVGFQATVIAVDKHVRVLTSRGIGMAVVSVIMVAVALSAKWAQFGVIAMAGLGLMYIFSTLATCVSAFSVRAFDDRMKRGRGGIDRELSPTVIDAGDSVEERFILARIPVPPGFRLHIEEVLPERLGGETRFAVDRSVSRTEATVSSPLPRTPRGVFRLGPAEIWYEDILGLTRVHVAARATANLRVLPRLYPIGFTKKPESRVKAEGALSVLSKLATEEHFMARPYTQGDDLRRVHWKLSVNTGTLHVRVPEAVPYAPRQVRLFLDTHFPLAQTYRGSDIEDILDLAVEGWIALAHALLKRGEKVTMCVPVVENGRITLCEMPCKRGEERKWRAVGSDVAWQAQMPLEHALMQGHDPKATAVVITAGLSPFAFRMPEGTSVIYAEHAPSTPEFSKRPLFDLLLHKYPVGADDNRIDWKAIFSPKPSPYMLAQQMSNGARVVMQSAEARAAEIFRLRKSGTHLVLEAGR